ncbi:MAG: hypothetical protein ACRCZI_03425 [Cetobacterium sp.]
MWTNIRIYKHIYFTTHCVSKHYNRIFEYIKDDGVSSIFRNELLYQTILTYDQELIY